MLQLSSNHNNNNNNIPGIKSWRRRKSLLIIIRKGFRWKLLMLKLKFSHFLKEWKTDENLSTAKERESERESVNLYFHIKFLHLFFQKILTNKNALSINIYLFFSHSLFIFFSERNFFFASWMFLNNNQWALCVYGVSVRWWFYD